ncbi:MAG: hypothetical protein QOK79_07510 [Nitrososphaeraceae archaeon]|nr:hypothetical protein [Nitrososphaeraceae archaeon]
MQVEYGATDCPNADGIPKDSIIIIIAVIIIPNIGNIFDILAYY